jgi:hypothetical protein
MVCVCVCVCTSGEGGSDTARDPGNDPGCDDPADADCCPAYDRGDEDDGGGGSTPPRASLAAAAARAAAAAGPDEDQLECLGSWPPSGVPLTRTSPGMECARLRAGAESSKLPTPPPPPPLRGDTPCGWLGICWRPNESRWSGDTLSASQCSSSLRVRGDTLEPSPPLPLPPTSPPLTRRTLSLSPAPRGW